MKIPLIVIALLVKSILSLGQSTTDVGKIKPAISTKDIYAVINVLIDKRKLDKNCGIQLVPEKYCYIDGDDSSYLQKLLIKPEQPDTLKKTYQIEFAAMDFPIPDKNIFTADDIVYIFKTKKQFKNLKWNNKQLGFNPKNGKYYYSFSIPYFNLKHDKVIIMYTSNCPGLCEYGITLLLIKKGDDWEIKEGGAWVH